MRSDTLFIITAFTCKTGWLVAENRPDLDSNGLTMVAPEKRIRCNGKVTMWTYQGKYSRPFRAIIFRPVEGSQTQFKIVGINDIPAGAASNGLVYYSVPESYQISVNYGDVIGWSSGDSVITFRTSHRVSLIRWLGGYLHADLVPDQILDFNSEFLREYSIEAYVIETSDVGKVHSYLLHNIDAQ